MKLMGNKLSSKLKLKIILGVIFLGIIIIPDVINYLRFGTETKERIEFILNNPYKISGTASYTNYDGKNKEGVVNNTFFKMLNIIMQRNSLKRSTSGEGFELYSVKIFNETYFLLNCRLEYWRPDNILEIAFFLNDSGYTNRRCYKVTEDEMDQFYNSIITIPNQ